MRKYLIIALSAALLLAFFGCGSPKEEPAGPPAGSEDFEEIWFDPLPTASTKPKTETGENNSNLYVFAGEDFAKIKNANPGSILVVKYAATVDYAVGEVGWKSITDAGPVIIGDGSNKPQTAYINVEDLFLGDADFTLHIFNGATLREVTLLAAPEDYEVTVNPKATQGAKKIFIPFGHKVPGNGDLSKTDFKKITTAASGSLVFYFNDDVPTDIGLMKFGPKSGDPYKHYGISAAGEIADGDTGWRPVDAETKTITYTVAEIKAGVTAAAKDFPTGKFNKLEINLGSSKRADLLYIELKP